MAVSTLEREKTSSIFQVINILTWMYNTFSQSSEEYLYIKQDNLLSNPPDQVSHYNSQLDWEVTYITGNFPITQAPKTW